MAGWAIAYVLVLQAFFATAAAAQMAAHPAAMDGTVFCLPSGNATSDLDPAAPSKAQHDDCCLICALSGVSGIAPSTAVLISPAGAAAETVSSTAYEPVVVAFARIRSGETRGPPVA